MRWTLQELGSALSIPDRSYPAGGPVQVSGFSIDSRTTEPGDLFVPIVAERDGHDFVAAAIDHGAVAYLRSSPDEVDARVPSLVVADTSEALLQLGRIGRTRLTGQVIGVTGSVGKTSVKDLIRAVCAEHTSAHANAASFNNELGVPLTILEAPEGAGVVVLEMGARNVGHVAQLCGIARPSVGVITSVAAVHTEIFGSIERVARAKGELAESIPADGTLVLNIDDPLVAAMAERTSARTVLTYGRLASGANADVCFSDVAMGADLRPSFVLTTPVGEARVQLGVAGAHMAQNAAAAAAAAIAVDVPLDAIIEGLRSPSISPMRMEVRRAESGAVVINDSYNANPTSMAAALDALSAVDAARRIAVVGLMAELGRTAEEDHQRITRRALDQGIEVIAVDTPMYGEGAVHVVDIGDAVTAVGELDSSIAVLVKGSRVAGLERVAELLLPADPKAQGAGG